ncbi:MAG: tyrosine--tRNA ligase, partial [Dehalococcoidia bacterium]|nr:tyrosine--tRNA ligase [Dehalococcoidia bacterium]
MLLQAYDFLTLYDRHGCVLQMGGSDQWGNITAGVDLIRRVRGVSAHALVTPLVTKSDGTKFGKSESGSVWLDADKTSPFQFYQFWLNTADMDVLRFMRYYTLLSRDEIGEFDEEVSERPERRAAQQRLAAEVTRMTHGDSGLHKALAATEVLFGGDISGLSADELLDVFQDVPSSSVPRERFEGDGVQLRDLVAEVELASSRGEARRLIQGGGVSLNNRRVSDARQTVSLEHSVDGQVIVLRRGARQYRLVRLQG